MSEELSAFHEAGHAAISVLLGELPEEASIIEQGQSDGHTTYLPVEARAIAEAAFGGTDEDQARVTAYLVGLAAGPCAQALHMRQGRRLEMAEPDTWEIFDGGQDYAQLERVLQAASWLDVEPGDIVEEAFDLLEQPDIWSSVEHLAADLVRFKELDYVGIRDAVLNHQAIRHQTVVDRLNWR
jgi:hypothetical protein